MVWACAQRGGLTASTFKESLTMTNQSAQPLLDFSICGREPIHTPGSIQPHGALLAARIDDLLVSHASANLFEILGVSAESALGQSQQHSLDEGVCRALCVARSLDGAHGSPRIPEPEMRAVADIIGQVVSLLLIALGEAEISAKRLERNATLEALIDRFAAPVPLPEALVAADAELLDLVDAAGAAIRFAGNVRCFGQTPAFEAAGRVLAMLYSAAGGETLALDDLTLRYPRFAECQTNGSGILLQPLANDTDDAIMWFRPEVSRTTNWAAIRTPTAPPIRLPVSYPRAILSPPGKRP
jgi:light-regulated signal transduction histidine kinase (bacteriophytochrome)